MILKCFKFLSGFVVIMYMQSIVIDIANMHFGSGLSRLDWAVSLLTANSPQFKTDQSILDWPPPKCVFTVSIEH